MTEPRQPEEPIMKPAPGAVAGYGSPDGGYGMPSALKYSSLEEKAGADDQRTPKERP